MLSYFKKGKKIERYDTNSKMFHQIGSFYDNFLVNWLRFCCFIQQSSPSPPVRHFINAKPKSK